MIQLKHSYDLETSVRLGESLLNRAEVIYEKAITDCQKLEDIFSTFFSINQAALNKLYIKKGDFSQLIGYYSKA